MRVIPIKEKTYEFSKPATTAWDETRVIPADRWERMKKGLWPQQMEDRWIIKHVEGDGEERIVFARSWTDYPCARITVVPVGEDGKSRQITKITWETDEGRWRPGEDAEKEAKDLVVGFSKGVFQVILTDKAEQESDDE